MARKDYDNTDTYSEEAIAEAMGGLSNISDDGSAVMFESERLTVTADRQGDGELLLVNVEADDEADIGQFELSLGV